MDEFENQFFILDDQDFVRIIQVLSEKNGIVPNYYSYLIVLFQ
jgi:hypothetical protein